MLPSVCVFGAGPVPRAATQLCSAFSASPSVIARRVCALRRSFRAAEVLVSPLHLAMVRVQSGASSNVASALIAAVKSAGPLAPWNGAWAFALKVTRFIRRGMALPFHTPLRRACSSLRAKWQHGERASNILAPKFTCRIWDSNAALSLWELWLAHFVLPFQPKSSGDKGDLSIF